MPPLQILILLLAVLCHLLFSCTIFLPNSLIDFSHLATPSFIMTAARVNSFLYLFFSLAIDVGHALVQSSEGTLHLLFLFMFQVQQLCGYLLLLVHCHRDLGHFICVQLFLRLKMFLSCSSANFRSSRVMDSMSSCSKTWTVDSDVCLILILLQLLQFRKR